MSDAEPISKTPESMPVDSIRAEVQREYAAKLAQAELKAQAAQSGIKLGDGFTDYLDASKLLGEDGNPSAEAIGEALAPFRPQEPKFAQLAGTGHSHRGGPIPQRRVSLDVRNR
ncbi:hypothetical protein OG427_05590 [Streptomyces sp. NBC_00133]|uniref:hypothetical protein n=1 Tax=Streptomyces sp. NBC_00133 TaxID=2903624 RepID=UPI00324D71D3